MMTKTCEIDVCEGIGYLNYRKHQTGSGLQRLRHGHLINLYILVRSFSFGHNHTYQ